MDDATTPNAFDGYNGGRRGLVHDTANVVSFVLCKTVSGKDERWIPADGDSNHYWSMEEEKGRVVFFSLDSVLMSV